LTTEDRVTLDEARAALERGRHLVLVTPPAVEHATAVWELVGPLAPDPAPGAGPPLLIVCADEVAAAEWAAAAPASARIHAVSGHARATRLLKEERVSVLAGAVPDIAALVTRSALKLERVVVVVVAWPEALAAGEHAAALDALLGDAREARRIVLSWNPAALGDFLERHARRALLVGAAPVSDTGAPLGPIGPARYAVVPQSRRTAALREALAVLDARCPYVWEGGAPAAPAGTPDVVLCTRLPTREQFAALSRLGPPVLLVTAGQLPYVRSLAAPLAPLPLPSAADRARDRAATLRDQIARLLAEGDLDAELALLDPLFERFDPAEVAAALLALGRQPRTASAAPTSAAPMWTKIFVNIGKKDRAAAKDLVGALIREVGVEKSQIGRLDVRDTFTLIEVAPVVAEKVTRGLAGVTIKGRRVLARPDRPG
jgi:hypothetical protein